MMKTINTSFGISFELDEKLLDNMELIDALAEIDSDPFAIITAADQLFGKELKKRIYDELREKNEGIVPASSFMMIIEETMNEFGNTGKK